MSAGAGEGTLAIRGLRAVHMSELPSRGRRWRFRFTRFGRSSAASEPVLGLNSNFATSSSRSPCTWCSSSTGTAAPIDSRQLPKVVPTS